ncbi:MAG: hypothetical protein WD768_06755 [Phycisphaeraceae bacterium]
MRTANPTPLSRLTLPVLLLGLFIASAAHAQRRPAPQPSRYRYTLEFDKETLPQGVEVREVKIGELRRYMVKNTSNTLLIFNEKFSADKLVAGDKVVAGKAYHYYPNGVPMEGKQHLKGWQAPFGDMEEAAILLEKDPDKIHQGRKPGLGKELPAPEKTVIATKYGDKPYDLKVTIHYHLNSAYDAKE